MRLLADLISCQTPNAVLKSCVEPVAQTCSTRYGVGVGVEMRGAGEKRLAVRAGCAIPAEEARSATGAAVATGCAAGSAGVPTAAADSQARPTSST
jgi:hypothetical protein